MPPSYYHQKGWIVVKPIRAMLIGAGSRGAKAYAPYALQHPDRIQFVAVAERNDERRADFCREHAIPPERTFTDFGPMFDAKIEADIVFVCTQDELHKAPALRALDEGYHLMLEKPISTNLADSEEIVAKAAQLNRLLIVGHVLRYTSFYSKIKEIIESGEIGDVLSISMNENVGYAHASHSYVRGNWRREDESSPMLLAKSCHDMDMACWLMGKPCTEVSSFGALNYFTAANAPEGSTARCLDGCKAKDACPFDCEKIYMDPEMTAWPVNVITHDISPEGRRKALREGPYGRCVFHCDNDVVDHQVVNLKFADNSTVGFAMNSLSSHTYRTISVYGTGGQLDGEMEANRLVKKIYGKEEEVITTQQPGASEYSHGGGDYGLMNHLVETVNGLTEGEKIGPSDAIISHRVCFAAEDSRHESKIVAL